MQFIVLLQVFKEIATFPETMKLWAEHLPLSARLDKTNYIILVRAASHMML